MWNNRYNKKQVVQEVSSEVKTVRLYTEKSLYFSSFVGIFLDRIYKNITFVFILTLRRKVPQGIETSPQSHAVSVAVRLFYLVRSVNYEV